MSGEQTTTNTAEPYGPLKPLINTAIKGGMKAFKQGYGANTGSNVVPMSKYTEQGNKNILGIANTNDNGSGLSGQYQDVINQGGFNDAMKTALGQFQNTATSQYNPNANPGFQGVLDSTLRDAENSVSRSASAAGRYGSAIHQGQLGRTTGDISNQMRSADFNTFLNRRDNATSALGNLGQAGINNLGLAYEGIKAPEKDRLAVGAQYEDLYRRQIDDRNRVQNLPWEQLSKLLAVGSGTGSYNTTTSTAPGPNSLLQVAGGLSLANGLSGMFL